MIYAEVLLEAAQVEGTAFEVSGQLRALQKAVRSSIALRETLADRSLPASTRRALLEKVFAGFDPALLVVLGVMIERDDFALLNKLSETYELCAEQALGAVIIDVTTAISLDDGLRTVLRDRFSAQFGCDVLLREQIDPTIIGGIVLSSHGKRIDASVASQLERARVALTTSR
jgi:F-type H+-transporting ATPase subunit delta